MASEREQRTGSLPEPPEGGVGPALTTDEGPIEPIGPYIQWREISEGRWDFTNHETLAEAVEQAMPARRRVLTKVVRYKVVEET